MNQSTHSIYSKKPIYEKQGIPVFSDTDEYIENYNQICAFHLSSMQKDGINPFIDESVWKEMEESTARLIKKYSKEDDKVLDVGVGLGRLLSYIPKVRKYGMDIAFGYLEIAQSKGIETCLALLEDMPYKEKSFDIVVCTDVLEHVIDLNLCCQKLLSVVKDNGYLIIRVPYKENLEAYLNPGYSYKYAHLRNFDENSLRLLFEKIFPCRVLEIEKMNCVQNYSRCNLKISPSEIGIKHKFINFILKNMVLLNRGIFYNLYTNYSESFYDSIKTIDYSKLENYLSILKKKNIDKYQDLLKKYYDPIEINIVIQPRG